MLVTFCGIIAGCDSWDDLELFGKTKIAYLRRYLPFKNGAPSDDTLRRFFRMLDPQAFESCFIRWVQSFQIDLTEKIIAVDGKTSRRSFDGKNRAMHLISAFVSELGITLGQLKTADKSNEITAIPELLNMLDIAGATVTIDAMGCQTKIVENIINKKANYVIGLKGNQSQLNHDVRLAFENKPNKMIFYTNHLIKDMVACFNDDQSRIRTGNATRNIALIKKTVINLLQIIKKIKPRVSLKAMRKLAAWDHHFLDTVLKPT